MAYVLLIALLLFNVLERRVREALKDEEEPLIIPDKKKTFRPTGKKILQKLQNMKVVTTPDLYRREFPANQKLPVRILKLAGFEPYIYLNIKGKPKTYKILTIKFFKHRVLKMCLTFHRENTSFFNHCDTKKDRKISGLSVLI
jgi:hypothetical protein